LEKIVCNRLNDYLLAEKIISENQFGFRKKHSTTHAMTHLLNNVAKSLNAKKTTIVLFCDLRKAFDTCNHQILFGKLKKYGISGIELEWFKSYLSNRKQFVQIGATHSSSK
jgi:retron-type reverse transcriptase